MRVSDGGHFVDTSIINNVIHDHGASGIVSLGSGAGVTSGTRVHGNVVSGSGPATGGIVFLADIVDDREVQNTFVENNLLAGNFDRNIRMVEAVGGVVQANHVSGEAAQGIHMHDTEGIVVTGNTVFGEPLTTSSDDTYGQVVESIPIPNDAWANFRLEE